MIITTNLNNYHIPNKAIAEIRADYYACEVDGFKRGSTEWKLEVQFGIDTPFELQDWVQNNMYPEEWTLLVTKVVPNSPSLEEDFGNIKIDATKD